MNDNMEDIRNQTLQALKRVYSDTAIEHGINPRNMEGIADADGITSFTGPCGDTMQIWLKINNDIVVNAGFLTDGCLATHACGSIATELIKGKHIAQAMNISQDQILDALGGLPDSNRHCALLTASAIKAAFVDYRTTQKEPWKKAYRRT